MSKFVFPKPPNESNHEYQNMVFPVRPFVQIITPDPDENQYLDLFNVPYNYFVDLAVNARPEEGFSGSLTVINPWAMSDNDEKRFKKFDDAMRKMIRLTFLDETDFVETLSAFDVALRWGWCDNEGGYFFSTWNRFRASDVKLSVAEQGVQYKLDFINPAFQACERIRIDRDIKPSDTITGSDDLIESTADLFFKYNVILDFPNEKEWKQYRVFKYDLETDAIQMVGDKPVKDPEGRRNRQWMFAQNDASGNAFEFPSCGKLSDVLNNVIRAVCFWDDVFEVDSDNRQYLEVHYDSQISWGINFENSVNSRLANDLTQQEVEQIRNTVGFVTIKRDNSKIHPRVYLRLDEVKPTSQANHDEVYGKFGIGGTSANMGFVTLTEKHQTSDVYEVMLNSRDCGLYRYYAGTGMVNEGNAYNNVGEQTLDKVRQSNISALGVNVATWLYTYVGDPMVASQIGASNGLFRQGGENGSPSTQSISQPSPDIARGQDASDNCNNAVSAVQQGKINSRISTGTIDILGDPSISQGVLNLRKNIHIMVYTPNGKPLPYWSGLYTVMGYSHNVSEGRYVTTLDLISIPFNEQEKVPVQKPEPTSFIPSLIPSLS